MIKSLESTLLIFWNRTKKDLPHEIGIGIRMKIRTRRLGNMYGDRRIIKLIVETSLINLMEMSFYVKFPGI